MAETPKNSNPYESKGNKFSKEHLESKGTKDDLKKEIEKNLEAKHSLILKFTTGQVEEQLKKIDDKKIKDIGSVFIFRNDSKNLTGDEVEKISKKISNINQNLKIFIDQEGGKVNRFIDFEDKIVKENYINNAIKKSGIKSTEEIQKILTELLESKDTFPSIESLKIAYTKAGDGIKLDFLNAITYLRLDTLKQRGINTYGLVADLDYGNNVISDLGRSFGKDPISYEIFGKAMIYNANKLGMTIYLKHFPGHGSNETDSHKGVLSYTDKDNEYLNKNISLFEKLLEYGDGKVGLMVGHMYIPNEYKDRFNRAISKANYVLTDDLGMKGYKDRNKESSNNKGKFFTTNLINGKNTIIVDTQKAETVR